MALQRDEKEYTVEVRIFNGTLDPRDFYKNIEFCRALFQYTRDDTMDTISPTGFRDFVEKTSKTYRNLVDFLYTTPYSYKHRFIKKERKYI